RPNHLLQTRLVAISAAALSRQYRYVLALHPIECEVVCGHRIQLLVHGEPLRGSRAAALDERRVAVGFDADEVRRVRYDRAVLSTDVASAFGFVGSRQNVQSIGTTDETLQVERQRGVAAVVGDGRGEALLIRLGQGFADLKAIVGEAREPRKCRRQAQIALDTAFARRLAKQVLNVD